MAEAESLCLEADDIHKTGEPLGRGSFGEVFVVDWHGTICAAKSLHPIFISDMLSREEQDKILRDFEREWKTWSRLRHPNICQFLGFYYRSDSPAPVYLMEKMDTSLRCHVDISSKEDFLFSDKLQVLLDTVRGLCYLHNQKPEPLVHHDLTPNNILMNITTFQSKLADFGMTRSVPLAKLTRESSTKGTCVFMPPEALCTPRRFNEKLDVFSFGVCLAYILSHTWPNPDHPTITVKGKIIALSEYRRRQAQFQKFNQREQELFLPIIKRCLEDDMVNRPSSATILSELKRISKPKILSPKGSSLSKLEERDALISQLHQQVKDMQNIKDQDKELIRKFCFEKEELQKKYEKLKLENQDHETKTHEALTPLNVIPKVSCKVKQNILHNDSKKFFNGISLSKSGLLAVADNFNSQVFIFHQNGKIDRVFKVRNKKEFVKSMPGLAFTSDDDIAIADFNGQLLLLYSKRGAHRMTIELNGQPASVAVSLTGNYYICMPEKHAITVYGKNGDYLFNFAQACLQNTPSNSKFEMRNPSAISVKGDRIYIVEELRRLVHIFSQDFEYIQTFQTSSKPRFFSVGHELCVVAENLGSKFYFYSTEGNQLHTLSLGDAVRCQGVVLDNQDVVYVSDGEGKIHSVTIRHLDVKSNPVI